MTGEKLEKINATHRELEDVQASLELATSAEAQRCGLQVAIEQEVDFRHGPRLLSDREFRAMPGITDEQRQVLRETVVDMLTRNEARLRREFAAL